MAGKTPRHRNDPNPERNRAMHGLRSSNAAQPHVPAPQKGTRTTKAHKAIQEQRHDN
jgi:hypothetical protein